MKNTNDQNYLVADMDKFIGINVSADEKWLKHWNETCDLMTERYEEINMRQPVITRKATKDEEKKWNAQINKKNPFRLG